MKATRISAKNVKGSSFDYELAPLTIITGENESGKTAIAIAVKIAMMKYDLKLGKRPSDTFKLAKGDAMSSELFFDDGSSNRVAYVKRGDSVSTNVKFAHEFPGILLNEKDYFDKGGPARNRFLFDLAANDIQFDLSELIADFKSIKLDPHPPEAEPIITELCEELEQSDQARVEMNTPLDEWFAKLVASFSGKCSVSNAVAKTHRNAIQASVATQAQAGIAIPVDQSAKIREKRELIDDVRLKETEFRDKFGVIERDRATRDNIIADRAQSEKTLKENPELADNTAKLRETVERCKRDCAAAADRIEVPPLDLTASNIRLKQREGLMQKLNEFNTAKAAHEANIVRLEMSSKKCEKCGAEPSHWDQKVLELNIDTLSKEKSGLQACETELKRLTTAKESMDLAIANDVQASTTYQKELESARVKNEESRKGSEAAMKALLAANQALSKAEGELKINKAVRESAQKILDAKTEMPDEPAPDAELKDDYMDTYRAYSLFQWNESFDLKQNMTRGFMLMIESLQGQIKELEIKQGDYTRHAASQSLREESKITAEDSELRGQVQEAALAKLVERQKKVITDGIRKFMDKASYLTKAVLGWSLEYRDGDIGYYRGGQWVTYEAFSGIQEALAFAGLRLSFAQDAPCKILIIDELGTFSKKRKMALLDRLLKLVNEGFIDNFIGIDVSANDWQGFFLKDEEQALRLRLIQIEDTDASGVKH